MEQSLRFQGTTEIIIKIYTFFRALTKEVGSITEKQIKKTSQLG